MVNCERRPQKQQLLQQGLLNSADEGGTKDSTVSLPSPAHKGGEHLSDIPQPKDQHEGA